MERAPDPPPPPPPPPPSLSPLLLAGRRLFSGTEGSTYSASLMTFRISTARPLPELFTVGNLTDHNNQSDS